MSALPAPPDSGRLAVLHELAILDTPPEPAYDDLASIAAAIFSGAGGAVCFLDGDRPFIKAIAGVAGAPGTRIAAETSFCARTIAAPEGLLLVPDTQADPDWCRHPLVAGGPRLRFFAGASIVTRGERVGVVCSFGGRPHEIAAGEVTALHALARLAQAQLDLRLHTAQLSALAITDPLTKAGNRVLLMDALTRALAEQPRVGGQVGVLFCNVDHFKFVNDDYGHEAGDRILCELVDRLRTLIRESDILARTAGAEFVVVCPRLTGPETLTEIADRMEGIRLSAPGPGAAQPRVTVAAALAREGETAAELLRRGDQEMHRHRHLRHRTALRLVG